jgi:hypothetical protein
MAAIDAAFSVTSRSDLAEMGAEGRNAAALRRIADTTWDAGTDPFGPLVHLLACEGR